MPRFKVVNQPLMIKGSVFKVGDLVDLDKKAAEAFGSDLESFKTPEDPNLLKVGYYKNPKTGEVMDLEKMTVDGVSADDLANQGWEKIGKKEYEKAIKELEEKK